MKSVFTDFEFVEIYFARYLSFLRQDNDSLGNSYKLRTRDAKKRNFNKHELHFGLARSHALTSKI